MILNDLIAVKEKELASQKKNRPALLHGGRVYILRFEGG